MNKRDKNYGVKIGPFIIFGPSPRQILEQATLADSSGFDSVWYADHLTSVLTGPQIDPNSICLELWTTLASIATHTKRLKIGSSVASSALRHPAITAQAAATLDRFSGGRFILGIGCGIPSQLNPIGIGTKFLVSKMKESITIIKRLWTEDCVNFEGKFYKCHGAYLQVKCIQKPYVPIYIAARQPNTLRVATTMGDGCIIGMPTTPESFEQYVQALNSVADINTKKDFDVVLLTHICFTKDHALALKLLRPVKSLVAFEVQELENIGYRDLAETIRSKIAREGSSDKVFTEVVKLIPDSVLEHFCIMGTADECLNRLEEYAKTGAKHIIFWNFSPDIKQMFKTFGQDIVPYLHSLKV